MLTDKTRTGGVTVRFGEVDVAVVVIRSARRRRTISVGVAGAVVTVRVPLRTTNGQIAEVLKKRAAWIEGRLTAAAAAPQPREFITGETLLYLGREFMLKVNAGPVRSASVALRDENISVEVPDTPPAAEGADAVRAALTAWYRERAGEVFRDVVAKWASTAGLTPKAVLVRDQRRRWGSCGPDGTLRLNWRLVMAEPTVIEYVVVHELVHLRHRHHRAAFWDEAARLLPDFRERRKRLLAAAVQLVL